MKTAILAIFVALPFSLAFGQSVERSVIGSAGDFRSAGNISISWTLGETVIQTATAGSVMLTQGFQQPESATNSLKELSKSSITVFPNPSNGLFKLNIAGFNDLNLLVVHVYDAAGKQVAIKNINVVSGAAGFDLTSLPEGIYTVHFTSNDPAISATYRLTVLK